MPDQQQTEQDGVVIEPLANGHYRVRLDDEREVTCRPSGRLRMVFSRIQAGDRVRLECALEDPSKGRIVHRYR